MITPLALSIVVALGLLALWGAVMFVRGRAPSRGFLTVLWIIELELVIQAIIAIAMRPGDDDPGPVAPFLGYLLLSVALLPFAARPLATERTRWDSAVAAFVCVAVAVVVLRLLSL